MNNKQRLFNLASLLLSLTATPVYSAFDGALESVDCDVIKGWAWDDTNPDTRAKLDIYDVGATKEIRLATLTAQLFRADLLEAGRGDGKYGFAFALPAGIRTGKAHQFSVRFQGTSTELTRSPQTTAMACYGKLNDTGVQQCNDTSNKDLACPATGYLGQDGDYGRDAKARAGELVKKGAGEAGFDFTKIANDGSKLPASAELGVGAKDWACTLDNVTGLLWEIKTLTGGFRDMANTYSWYNPDNATNGGFAGYQNGGRCGGTIACDTQAYIDAVNTLKLCGKSDWRVPKQGELYSILNYSPLPIQHGLPKKVSIDTDYFPNTGADHSSMDHVYWSSTPAADRRGYAWTANIVEGSNYFDVKRNSWSVLLVRGGQ